jgi:hypothetical protein
MYCLTLVPVPGMFYFLGQGIQIPGQLCMEWNKYIRWFRLRRQEVHPILYFPWETESSQAGRGNGSHTDHQGRCQEEQTILLVMDTSEEVKRATLPCKCIQLENAAFPPPWSLNKKKSLVCIKNQLTKKLKGLYLGIIVTWHSPTMNGIAGVSFIIYSMNIVNWKLTSLLNGMQFC